MFCCLLLTMGIFYFDYIYNEKSYDVEFYTVTAMDIQERAEIKGTISKTGNINMLSGTLPAYKAETISVGAYAKVNVQGKSYDGNVYETAPLYNDLYAVKISIMTEENLFGEATASIAGDMLKNIKIVPYSCIFTDETGADAIMLENRGYAVKRKVKLGKINNEKGTEIIDGLFLDERLILNPHSIKTGDRVN